MLVQEKERVSCLIGRYEVTSRKWTKRVVTGREGPRIS